MPTTRRTPAHNSLDPGHIPGLPDDVLMGLLTTHLGRLASTRGEVLLGHERARITRYCFELATEARMRGQQARLF